MYKRQVHIAQFLRHGGVVHHAAAAECHLAAILHSQIDDLLHAVDVGSKGGNDDPLDVYKRQLLLFDLGLGFGRGNNAPHLIKGVHIEGQVVDLAVVVCHRAVGVAVELCKLVHICLLYTS